MKPRLILSLFLFILIGCGDDDEVTVCQTNCDPDTLDYEVLPHTLWTAGAGNPSLAPGGLWDGEFINSPSVVLFDDTLRMWYEGSDTEHYDAIVEIGYAWSLDGISWNTQDASQLKTTSGTWQYPHLALPHVLVDGDTLRMWFGGGMIKASGMVIGYATSTDGQDWVMHEDPVIFPEKEWNQDGVMPGPVIKEGGEFKMWLAGGIGPFAYATTDSRWATGYATSTDGIHWEVSDEPVLLPGDDGEFDSFAALAGTVMKNGATYEMWYAGSRKVANVTRSDIGFATSSDGIAWEKYEGNSILATSSGSVALYTPRVLWHEGQLKMWYSAWLPGPTIHYATAEN